VYLEAKEEETRVQMKGKSFLDRGGSGTEPAFLKKKCCYNAQKTAVKFMKNLHELAGHPAEKV